MLAPFSAHHGLLILGALVTPVKSKFKVHSCSVHFTLWPKSLTSEQRHGVTGQDSEGVPPACIFAEAISLTKILCL